MTDRTDIAVRSPWGALVFGLLVVVACLGAAGAWGWWLGVPWAQEDHLPTAQHATDPAWNDLPDGGVLLGEDLCDVLPDGCTEWRDGGHP